MSQIVAPLTKIVAFFEKKILGAFWRFLTQKRALSNSKLLATLQKISVATCGDLSPLWGF